MQVPNNKIMNMLDMKFDSIDDALDFIEMRMVEDYDLMDFPVNHRFTEGAYSREIHMPTGSLITSKKHKTRHQFIISKGAAAVLDQNGEWKLLEAPYHGITDPGTRRLLYILDDCIWTTFHVTDKTTVEEVERDIIEDRDNRFIGNIKQYLK